MILTEMYNIFFDHKFVCGSFKSVRALWQFVGLHFGASNFIMSTRESIPSFLRDADINTQADLLLRVAVMNTHTHTHRRSNDAGKWLLDIYLFIIKARWWEILPFA